MTSKPSKSIVTKQGGGKAGGGAVAGGARGVIEDDGPIKKPGEGIESGGIGTLIVRIVAARDLPAAIGGGFFSHGSSNPYCMLEFEGHTQITSIMADTLNPIWPREQYFFEVKMPAMHADNDEVASFKMGSKGGDKAMFSSSEPHLHVMLVHKAEVEALTAGGVATTKKSPHKSDPSVVVKPKTGQVPPGDKLLGEAFVNVVDLTTARIKNMDEWFQLSEGGAIRLSVEYDVLEAAPERGEVVRLLGFGSATDLWPLPIREEMLVEGYVDSNHERLLVSYQTSEGWKCTAEVHRFHVISAGRHRSIVNEYQDKMLDAAISFMETPLMNAVNGALDKVCDGESLSEVGKDLWHGALNTGSRWLSGGLSTAFADVKYALRPQPEDEGEGDEQEEEEGEEGGGRRGTTTAGGKKMVGRQEGGGKEREEEDYVYEYIPAEQLHRILCPITGLPMKDPVTAADGHAYEREAIERWLEEHDTSPMTGAILPTIAIFACRPMLETVEEFKMKNEAMKKKAASAVGMFKNLKSSIAAASGGDSAAEGGEGGGKAAPVVVGGDVEESKTSTSNGEEGEGRWRKEALNVNGDEGKEKEEERESKGDSLKPPVIPLAAVPAPLPATPSSPSPSLSSSLQVEPSASSLASLAYQKDDGKSPTSSNGPISPSSTTGSEAKRERAGELEEKEDSKRRQPAAVRENTTAAATGEVVQVLDRIMQEVVDLSGQKAGSP